MSVQTQWLFALAEKAVPGQSVSGKRKHSELSVTGKGLKVELLKPLQLERLGLMFQLVFCNRFDVLLVYCCSSVLGFDFLLQLARGFADKFFNRCLAFGIFSFAAPWVIGWLNRLFNNGRCSYFFKFEINGLVEQLGRNRVFGNLGVLDFDEDHFVLLDRSELFDECACISLVHGGNARQNYERLRGAVCVECALAVFVESRDGLDVAEVAGVLLDVLELGVVFKVHP